MAAKLKKRALAEYQSQTSVLPATTLPSAEDQQPRKRLKLVLSRSSGSSSSRAAEHNPLPIEKAANTTELSATIIKFLSRLRWLERDDLTESARKLCEALSKRSLDNGVRVQVLLALGLIVGRGPAKSEDARAIVRDCLEDWVQMLRTEKSFKVTAAVLGLVATLQDNGVRFAKQLNEKIFAIANDKLRDSDHTVKINAIKVLGKCVVYSGDEGLSSQSLVIAGKFTQSTDPRIRHSAFETLLEIHQHDHRLDVNMYKLFCQALEDDFDCVRLVALRLVNAMAKSYPEERVRVTSMKGSKGATESTLRLVDDAFGKTCNAINDLAVQVRELAAKLIGEMKQVSPEFLEQTLDKKLMSNMRLKSSAHEREAKMVSSGEWSSGKKWADDAPKEELAAEAIHLMSFGACGAFIHGLEDEFLAVRSASIDALTNLSIQNPRLAFLALDFLVDMFNDEIELVRLKAIESLRRIAAHISLQVHQLETILSALDDFSIVVREKLHIMLQASTVATKDGLQNVISKLLENLKKYPQDKRSILCTFKRLGERHSELTLPLVTQLLEIHPFFDIAEPDIEDPAYLCILVLVFNAAQHCPTMEPLLDQHTRKHYHFLLDTCPHLMPLREEQEVQKTLTKTNTERFLKQTLARLNDSEHLSMANRLKLLQRSSLDLRRLGSIEPAMADSTQFADLYLQCQILFLSTLSTKFWSNPQAMSSQQIAIVETNISSLFGLCMQLRQRFTHLNETQVHQIQLLKINIIALHMLFLVRASNKSALSATEQFLREVDRLVTKSSDEAIASSPLLSSLIRKLTEAEDHKPGNMARILQPLLIAYPLESLAFNGEVAMSRAVIYDPQGMNETPLKYSAGMVLAVPVDCELFHVKDASLIRIAIKTPDQKIQLVTPKTSHFFQKEEAPNCYRLLTDALMSHQVWSEALHVEISIVLDLSASHGEIEGKRNAKSCGKDAEKNIIHLCEPVKVYVLPKGVKRGI